MKYRVKAGRYILINNKCYNHTDSLPDNYSPPQDWIDQQIVIEDKKIKKEASKTEVKDGK